MSLSQFSISNLIVPEVFNDHFLEETAEKVRLIAPMVNQDNRFADRLANGGLQVEMPFFQDLSGASSPYDVGDSISVDRLSDSDDNARRQGRAKGWTVNDLEDELTGDDPLGAVASRVGAYWARESQRILIHSLTGVFEDNLNNDGGDLIHDIASDDYDNEATPSDFHLDRTAVARAKNKIGDSGDTLTTIAVHSDVYTQLQVEDQIRTERDSEANLEFESFAGKRIIVMDTLPTKDGATTGTKYTSYLFGENSVGYAEGMANVPSELDRQAQESETRLFTRRQFVMHPRGFKWTESSVAGKFPTDGELENGSNWERVFEKKNTRMVKMVSNAPVG